MPVAVPLIGTAVSAAAGGIQKAQAERDKKNAQQAINNYKRQDLVNPFGQLSASTLGARIRQENSARALANIGYQSAMGGSRAIAGILPNALEQQNNMDAQIAADLDQQQAQIDQLKANGEMRVQTLQEQREIADLAGLGTKLDLANAQASDARNKLMGGVANGIVGVATAGMASMDAGKGFFGQTKPNTVTNTTPMSVNSISEMKSGYNLQKPVFSNNNAYAFGNNINGFAYSNPNLPAFGYKKLR